eukprot:scaffold6870_cov121-Cylindrotheca_fusiformis.AAC.1
MEFTSMGLNVDVSPEWNTTPICCQTQNGAFHFLSTTIPTKAIASGQGIYHSQSASLFRKSIHLETMAP